MPERSEHWFDRPHGWDRDEIHVFSDKEPANSEIDYMGPINTEIYRALDEPHVFDTEYAVQTPPVRFGEGADICDEIFDQGDIPQ